MGITERRQAIIGIIDGVFVVLANTLTLLLAPEYLPFALSVCTLLQPLVVVLVLHWTVDRVAQVFARAFLQLQGAQRTDHSSRAEPDEF